MANHSSRTSAQPLPSLITAAISSYGYANRHPEDADGIAQAYNCLVSAISSTFNPKPDQSESDRQAFEAGRKRATCWFAQNGHTLAVFRDLKRAEYIQSLPQAPSDGAATLTSFDAGFAAGLADLIAGACHD